MGRGWSGGAEGFVVRGVGADKGVIGVGGGRGGPARGSARIAVEAYGQILMQQGAQLGRPAGIRRCVCVCVCACVCVCVCVCVLCVYASAFSYRTCSWKNTHCTSLVTDPFHSKHAHSHSHPHQYHTPTTVKYLVQQIIRSHTHTQTSHLQP